MAEAIISRRGGQGLKIVGQDEIQAEFLDVIGKREPVKIIAEVLMPPKNKLSDPSSLPTGDGNGIAFSSDGIYMAVAYSTYPRIIIYKRSGDTFTKLPDPSPLPPNSGYGIAFSSDGIYMAVAHADSPFITIYKRSGDTFTKLPNPSSLPASHSNGVAFSSDGAYMTVAHRISPFITIYKGETKEFAEPTGNNISSISGASALGYAKQAGGVGEVKTVVKIWG